MNAAVIPAPPCETLVYDWYARHEAVKAHIRNNPVDLAFLGDSITHLFGGRPKYDDPTAADVWEKYYGHRCAINLGFGWDRTQQMLWRIDHGELDGVAPKVVVVMAGGNNLLGGNVRVNTPDEIVAAVHLLCDRILDKTPTSRILLLHVFPRGQTKTDPCRMGIEEINSGMKDNLADHANVTLLDITGSFLNPDSIISPEIMADYVHLTAKGYRIWAERMEPVISALLENRIDNSSKRDNTLKTKNIKSNR